MFRNVEVCLVLAGTALTMSAGCGSSSGSDVEDASTTEAPETGTYAEELAAAEAVELPAGTTFVVALETPLGTGGSRSGDSFLAHLDEPILHGGEVVVPEGATVQGTVSEVARGEETSMVLAFTDIETPDGMKPLDVQPIQLIAEPAGSANAVRIPGAGAAGDVIGAETDGGRDAAVEDATSVTAEMNAVLVEGDEVELPRGQRIALRLDAPARIPVRG
jgi:hypothetical protein